MDAIHRAFSSSWSDERTACSLALNQDPLVCIKSAMSSACSVRQLAVYMLWGHTMWQQSMSGSGRIGLTSSVAARELCGVLTASQRKQS